MSQILRNKSLIGKRRAKMQHMMHVLRRDNFRIGIQSAKGIGEWSGVGCNSVTTTILLFHMSICIVDEISVRSNAKKVTKHKIVSFGHS